jgi:hypothetical protein
MIYAIHPALTFDLVAFSFADSGQFRKTSTTVKNSETAGRQASTQRNVATDNRNAWQPLFSSLTSITSVTVQTIIPNEAGMAI